jgi:alkylation response protein AidB-like acyl-CoA dehydrogenase
VQLDLSASESRRGDEVRDVLAAWGDRDRVRAVLGTDDGLDRELLQGLAGRGWFDASRAAGAPTCTEVVVALTEAGRHPVPGPLATAAVAASSVLARLRHTDAARGAARFDPWTAWCGDGAAVTARPSRGGWILDGGVPLVAHGRHATRLLVPARVDDTPGRTTALFDVPARASGVTLVPVDTVGDDRPTSIRFDDVPVPSGAVLADHVRIDDLLDVAVLGVSAELLGAAEAALEVGVRYVTGREVFGRPVGAFQAIQHRLADLHIEVCAMRDAVLAAAGAADRGAAFAAEASAAKVVCAEGAPRVTAAVHQVHGGEGFYADRDPGLFYRRARALAPRFGDVRTHLARLDGMRRAVGARRFRAEVLGGP